MLLRSLTAEEGLEAEELDPVLALDQVGSVGVGRAGAGPVHLTLAEAHGVDVVSAHLQDESAVHDVQQAAREHSLLVVRDVFGGGEAHLLQTDGAEQLLLIDDGPQISVEQTTALRVTDDHRRTHLLTAVIELHLQIRHYTHTQGILGKIRQALMLHIQQLNMLNNINAFINDTFDMFLHTGQHNLTFKTKM